MKRKESDYLTELYKGDCLEYMREMGNSSVDLTVTSPPYDNLRNYNGHINQWTFEKFQNIAKELYRITTEGGVVVWVVGDASINGSETGSSFQQVLYFKECGFRIHDTMIWNKQLTLFPDPTRYYQSFEYMFVLSKGRPKTVNLLRDRPNKATGKRVCHSYRNPDGSVSESNGNRVERRTQKFGVRQNVWDIYPVQSSKERTGHPAQFPEQLVRDHIISWSNEGDTVFDPFMGSGTTGKVALDLNRDFIGSEIDDTYFTIAERRINNYTVKEIAS